MKLYVYSNETGEVVDIIEGDSNEDCESQMADKWDTNDYSATYSPGLVVPEIGDCICTTR